MHRVGRQGGLRVDEVNERRSHGGPPPEVQGHQGCAWRDWLRAFASVRAASRRTIVLVLLLVAGPIFAADTAIHVQVDGLACPFCAYGLEKKLKPLPGVTAVRIDYQAGWVELTLGDGTTLEEATIRRAVRAAGFTPRAIHRVAPGDGYDPGEEGR